MVMPVLVVGRDGAWRARMQRLLATRADLFWLGAYLPAQPRRTAHEPATVLLLDGDDPTVERSPRRPLLPAPRRLYFFRNPLGGDLLRCARAHAHGCMDKLAPVEAVLRAVRAAESDLFSVAPGLLRLVLSDWTPRAVPLRVIGSRRLTARQREIAHWAALGLSNKQIARQLGISPETVKTHLQHAFEREGVHGRVALLLGRQDAVGAGVDGDGSATREPPRADD